MSDFQIDVLQLDQEWLKQAGLHHEYATRLADAKLELERLKATAAVNAAELELAMRADPDGYELPKVTDSVITAALAAEPDVQKYQQLIREAKHEVDILSGACGALYDKRKALENLVQLHGQDYFSTPRVPPAGSEAIQNAVKSNTRGKVARPRRRTRTEDGT